MNRYDFYVRSKNDLIEAVETFGIVPYFRTSIPGFSLEEHCHPAALWSDDGDDSWSWKGPVIRETGCAYGKFFEKKAVYVSRKLFPDLANYRRDGYDFDARYDDGLAKYQDRQLYELIEKSAPVLSRQLRSEGNYAYSGRWQKTEGIKGFDTIITRLQEQCYVLISDFVYTTDRKGRKRGWGVAQYSTPEKHMGLEFEENVYNNSPEESRGILMEHLSSLFPDVSEDKLRKFLR